jgi:hypothetical protein
MITKYIPGSDILYVLRSTYVRTETTDFEFSTENNVIHTSGLVSDLWVSLSILIDIFYAIFCYSAIGSDRREEWPPNTKIPAAVPVIAAVFDGRRLVSGKIAQIWDVEMGKLVGRHRDTIKSVPFSPDGRGMVFAWSRARAMEQFKSGIQRRGSTRGSRWEGRLTI